MKKYTSEEWIKRYSKTKSGKLFDMLYELKDLSLDYNKRVNKISYLAAALSLITKNTKYEIDAKEIIELTYPEYLNEDL